MRSPVLRDACLMQSALRVVPPARRLRSTARAPSFACLLVACCVGCEPAGDDGEPADAAVDAGAEEFFQCPSGHLFDPDPDVIVLPLSAHCDGELDCPSGADEASCTGQFLCRQRSQGPRSVLPDSVRCDGQVDCYSSDDELDCPGQLVCRSSDGPGEDYVIGAEKLCDGRIDCFDSARDERDCPDTFLCIVPNPLGGENGHRALPRAKVCDGTWDCPSDEFGCPGDDPFTCADGKTIDRRYLCDQYYHCWDGTDETSAVCPDQFRCADTPWFYPGTVNCPQCGPLFVPMEKACDGTADCADGEDEDQLACPLVPCSSTSPLFVPRGKLCNGAPDCPGAEDEADCPP